MKFANGPSESVEKEYIMDMSLSNVASPLGDILLVTDSQQVVRALDFVDHKARLHRSLREHYGSVELTESTTPSEIAQAIARYFLGEFRAFDIVRTETAGSDLQRRVWAAVRQIPAGTTTTYGKLAKKLGFDDPRAAIDIGAAIGTNPIGIIVPCHRVIASNGDLKGYAWGVHRKRWLLEHEKAIAPQRLEPQTALLPGI
jgi:methylated-DNA-[protein]-cysteine S-methyltransferase